MPTFILLIVPTQNAFFFMFWENDTTVNEILRNNSAKGNPMFGGQEPFLLTQAKTRRQKVPLRYRKRSKFITRPELTIEVANHYVWEKIGESYLCNPAWNALRLTCPG
mgnify:CR=1 FL=1